MNVQKVVTGVMTQTDYDSREEDKILRKENEQTQFTVRLHFTQNGQSGRLVQDIQKILTETFINSFSHREE